MDEQTQQQQQEPELTPAEKMAKRIEEATAASERRHHEVKASVESVAAGVATVNVTANAILEVVAPNHEGLLDGTVAWLNRKIDGALFYLKPIAAGAVVVYGASRGLGAVKSWRKERAAKKAAALAPPPPAPAS